MTAYVHSDFLVGSEMCIRDRLWIDQETGVAITNGGYFQDGYELFRYGNVDFPDTVRAATYDIQDANSPLLVGGESALPSGPEGQQFFSTLTQAMPLVGKLLEGMPITDEEQRIVDQSEIYNYETGVDSIRVLPREEWEEGGRGLRILRPV